MKEKGKDKELEREFREYFDGAAKPHCDLAEAKRAISQERRAEKPRNKGVIAAVISACASAACVLVIAVALLPSFIGRGNTQAPSINDPAAVVYSLSETTPRTVNASDLRKDYADEIKPFTSFEQASNASCAYALVEREGEPVLIRAELSYTGSMKFEATVYIDVTNGACVASELEDYRALPNQKYGVRYETVTDGETGSYVSRAFREGAADYYIAMISDSETALDSLINLFKKN